MLLSEITNDPLSVGYSTMTDLQVSQSLNTVNRVLARESISGSELFGYTDAAEYTALTDGQKQQWLGLCGIDTVLKSAVPLIKSLFGNGTVTWGAIVKTETVSRAQELGLGSINEGDVKHARLA